MKMIFHSNQNFPFSLGEVFYLQKTSHKNKVFKYLNKETLLDE